MAEVRVGGVDLHVQRLGRGPATVVFLHGLVMDNLSSWYFTVANPVAARQGVLLYDLRGHGRSARPESGYGLLDLVEELRALLAAEDLGPVTLVGNSFGGLLALAFALCHPERVAGLVLVDALLPQAGWGDRMAGTLGITGEQRTVQIASRFEHWLGRHSERKRNRLAQQAQALVEHTTLLADVQASPTWSDAALAALACPILAIYGAESDVLDQGRRLQAATGCTLEVLPGCSHSVLWQATGDVRDRIVGWLA